MLCQASVSCTLPCGLHLLNLHTRLHPLPVPPPTQKNHTHPAHPPTTTDAGEETDNSALRTWPALAKTLAHLRSILGRLGAPDWGTDRQAVFDLLEAHRFLWDRWVSGG